MLKLDNVSKKYRTTEVETSALDGVSLEIAQGEFVAVMGPSGCGKSTLLSILGLLDTPSDGQYSLHGSPVTNLKPAQRARVRNREIGFIFQSFNLIGDLNVYENVAGPEARAQLQGRPSSDSASPNPSPREVQPAVPRRTSRHRVGIAGEAPDDYCVRRSRVRSAQEGGGSGDDRR